jgi:hypothetical protein
VEYVSAPKGNQVNIPEPDMGDRLFGGQRGNANLLCEVDTAPGERSLLFLSASLSLEWVRPEIGMWAHKAARLLRSPCAAVSTLEKQSYGE